MIEEDQLVQHMLLVKMRTNNTNVELLMERQFCKVIQAMLPRSMVVVNHTSHQLQKMARILKSRTFLFTNQFEKLPESTITVKSEPMETSVEPPLAPQGQQQDDSNPMLPPNGKPVEITGAPLMGFTMGKLAEGGAGTVADKSWPKSRC